MNKLDQWCSRVVGFFAVIAALCTLAMMLLTTADAAGRYLMNSPISGSDEITEKYLMPALVFLGLGYAYKGGVFIRVTFVADRIKGVLKTFIDYVVQFITIACCAMLAWASAEQAMRVVGDRTSLSTVDFPLAPAYFVIPIGFALLVALLLLDVPRVPKGESMLFKEGSEDTN